MMGILSIFVDITEFNVTGTWVLVFILFLVLLLFFVGWAISIFNSLIYASNNVKKSWKNIEVLLLQRHDEISKLTDLCGTYMKYENTALSSVIKLRTDFNNARGTEEKPAIENRYNTGVREFRLQIENYPELKSNEVLKNLNSAISRIETNIAGRRIFFNDTVNIYNTLIAKIPHVFLAQLIGYKPFSFLTEKDDSIPGIN